MLQIYNHGANGVKIRVLTRITLNVLAAFLVENIFIKKATSKEIYTSNCY
jgi:hypothetical protein